MHVLQELRGVQGACDVLEQTVAHLKQRLSAEELLRAELTGVMNLLIRACMQKQPMPDWVDGVAHC